MSTASATLCANRSVGNPLPRCLEIAVAWGDTLLRVLHLSPSRNLYIGADPDCDVLVPADLLKAPRLAIVETTREGELWMVVPEASRGILQYPTAPFVGQVRAFEGSPSERRFPLSLGAVGWIELGALRLRLALQEATPRPARASRTLGALVWGMMFLSAGFHAALLLTGFLHKPPLGISESEEADREQRVLLQHYLTATAQPERDWPEAAYVAEEPTQEGGSGTRATGEEGAMGSTVYRGPLRRFGVQGPRDNYDSHIASQAARNEAAEFGLIGLLNAGAGGDPKALVAPWGRDTSLGSDPLSATGALWGEQLGEAYGAGGLGLSGIGEGGGGRGEGLGLGRIRTVGRGAGNGTGQGFGDGAGFGFGACGCGGGMIGHYGAGSTGSYGRSGGALRFGQTHVEGDPPSTRGQNASAGRLPAESIQRIVRANAGRYRACYQKALRYNPALSGRVAVRFLIARDGSVAVASDGGSDLADRGVVQCVISSFRELSFPTPAGGVVSVLYPLVFSPS